MLLLLIVDRELRVASRKRRMYIGRVVSGTIALGVSLYLIWLAHMMMGGPMAGLFILKGTTYMAWALCLFGGVNRTCDSLSAEKRGDTLGLLFLTHLKGADVVLGKLAASGLSAVLLLLGVLPILSIPVLLGGVAANEMVRIPVALFTSLFLALSVGLLVSSLFRAQRAAAAAAGGTIVLLAVVLPSVAQIVEREWQWPELGRWLSVPSPLHLQELSFSVSFGSSTDDFWIAFAVQFGMALAALAGACVIAPRTWKVRAESAATERFRERLKHWTHGTAANRLRRRTRFLARNPWFWICYRDRFAPLWPVLFAVTTLAVTGWCIVHYALDKGEACGAFFAALAVNDLMVRMRVAAMGATRFAEDRQTGALEMILSTPLTLREIVKGQWMAIRRTHRWVYGGLVVSYWIVVSVSLQGIADLHETMQSLFIAGLFAVLSIGDFVVIGYVAMWKGMRVNNPRHGAGAATVRVLVVPWLVWLVFFPLVHQFDDLEQFFSSHAPYSFLVAALVIWGTNSATALVSARRNLSRYFREAATDRYLFDQRFRGFRWWRRRTPSDARPSTITIREHGIDRAAFAPAHFGDNR
jgi:ABC-type Na+ efflux pump permease subunit